jgi:hypothetical protein
MYGACNSRQKNAEKIFLKKIKGRAAQGAGWPFEKKTAIAGNLTACFTRLLQWQSAQLNQTDLLL